MRYETKRLAEDYDYLAPDGSEIRLLPVMSGGGLCHCSLPVGNTSEAVKHKTVEEIWYFLAGKGEVWREQDRRSEVTNVGSGVSLTIPVGTRFQFRNTGDEPLTFVIATMPPWPGEEEGKEEAIPVDGHWD